MCRRLRTTPCTRSPLVKRNFPTSASRRSMCSTRRTLQRPRTAFRWRGAAAAVAEAAEVAEVAGLAEAVPAARVAAAAVAAAAVCRGDPVAFAELYSVQITLTNADGHGRVRQSRPGLSMFDWRCCPRLCAGWPVHGGRAGIQPYREMPARGLDEGFAVVEEYALHRRAGIAGRVRVRKP